MGAEIGCQHASFFNLRSFLYDGNTGPQEKLLEQWCMCARTILHYDERAKEPHHHITTNLGQRATQ